MPSAENHQGICAPMFQAEYRPKPRFLKTGFKPGFPVFRILKTENRFLKNVITVSFPSSNVFEFELKCKNQKLKQRF
jgi:hypothetical protein